MSLRFQLHPTDFIRMPYKYRTQSNAELNKMLSPILWAEAKNYIFLN